MQQPLLLVYGRSHCCVCVPYAEMGAVLGLAHAVSGAFVFYAHCSVERNFAVPCASVFPTES